MRVCLYLEHNKLYKIFIQNYKVENIYFVGNKISILREILLIFLQRLASNNKSILLRQTLT